jgi:hypothetical protein
MRKVGCSRGRPARARSACSRAGGGAVWTWAASVPPAEDQGRGNGGGQGRVTGRAERGDQDRPEEKGGGVGQRFQGEGGGQLIGPFTAQQVGPAGRGQGAELGDGRAGAGGGGDRGGGGGGCEDAGDGGAMGEEGERQDAGLTEPVDQTGQMRADQGLGEGESGSGEAGGAVGASAGVQQPDQAKAGHGDADAADSGGEEEGGGAGGAQQATVADSGVRHDSALTAARRGEPPGVAGALSDAERCDPWPARGRPGPRRNGTRALAAAPTPGGGETSGPGQGGSGRLRQR